ncbi:MAG: MFS transporter [Methanothrix sp.]|nr:MFS transporter [Methanothrix sp.]
MGNHAESRDLEPESGSKNRYIVLLLVLTGVMMAVVDGSVVSIALPTITEYFRVSLAQSQMIMTSYLVTLTSLLMIFGKVAEYVGRARLFWLGIALFSFSSLACGISTSLSLLVICRIIQAAGAAMMFSISSAIIFQAFPRGEQGRAIGYIGVAVAIGSILGPSLGGFIVDLWGWQYIFIINVPIGIIQLLLSSRYMRIEEIRSSSLEVDWIGAVTLITFIVSLMALLGQLSISFTFQPSILALALIFLGSLAAFVTIESRQKVPILDLSIFRYTMFMLPCISMILFFVANMMISILGPFYFEGVMGYTASQVGLIYLIIPAIMVIGAPVTGWIYDKHQFRYLAALGMTILAISMMLLGYLAGRTSTDPRLLLLTFVSMGIGGVLFSGPNNTEIMRGLPKAKINIASSFSATIRNLGMALGVSFSGVLVSLQLVQAGYYGTLVQAGPELLSLTMSRVMMLAGMLCIISTLVSIYRGKNSAK